MAIVMKEPKDIQVGDWLATDNGTKHRVHAVYRLGDRRWGIDVYGMMIQCEDGVPVATVVD